MNAPHAETERVLDYAYGELSGPEKSEFETHLSSCPECQAELASIRGVRAQKRFRKNRLDCIEWVH